MSTNTNPYQSPSEEPYERNRIFVRRGLSTPRWIAAALIVMPFLLALPIRYWAFHLAGSWFVSTDLEPNRRADLLGGMYHGLMFSLTVVFAFPAFLLLWSDRFHALWTGLATVVLGILLVPALLFLAIGTLSYWHNG